MKRALIIVSAIPILIVIGVVLVLLLGYSAITHVAAVDTSTTLTDLPINTWTQINLSEKTQCSDGSNYRIYVRRQAGDNLLIHFAGGGMAWDARSAAKPITITDTKGFYFPNIWEIIRATIGGVFDANNPKNPFATWSEVYIPYCTGDFHIGDTDITYPLENGKSLTIHHKGRQNVTEALDWVYATFENPPKLLVSGESAGAFGSTFWTPLIAKHYAQSQTYNLSDGAFLKTAQWPEIVNTVWKADSQKNLGFTPTDNLINSAYLRESQPSDPHVTYLQINTLYDGTLIYFASVLNDKSYDSDFIKSWSADMRASAKEVAESDLDYNYYLTDYGASDQDGTTPHTSISNELFYQIQQDKVALVDWVQRIVIGGESLSVGSQFLP